MKGYGSCRHIRMQSCTFNAGEVACLLYMSCSVLTKLFELRTVELERELSALVARSVFFARRLIHSRRVCSELSFPSVERAIASIRRAAPIR